MGTFKSSSAYGAQEQSQAVPVTDENEIGQPLTDWAQFIKGRFVPSEIVCQEYLPVHISTTSCHSRLLTKRAKDGAPTDPRTKKPRKTGSAQSMLEHTAAGHGGGFKITFKQHEAGGETWAGWEEMKAAGVEVVDLRCAWCLKSEDRVHAGSLLQHFKPHKGNGRGLKASNEFLMTLALNRNQVEEEDEE